MKKLSVVFLLLCIILFIIYKYTYKDNNKVLLLGEPQVLELLETYDDKNIDVFLYDNITYKNLLKEIKNNSKKIVKGKNIFLNQLIASSKEIVIYANTKEYNNKCKKNNYILSNYNEILENDINNIIYEIKKMSNARVIVIGNHCNNNHYIQNLDIEGTYVPYQNNN